MSEQEVELTLEELQHAAKPKSSLWDLWESYKVTNKVDAGVRPNIVAVCRILRDTPVTRENAQRAAVLLRKSGQTKVAVDLLMHLDFSEDAADILATSSRLDEAALLYVKASVWPEAIRCYTILQDFHRAARCAARAKDYELAAKLFNRADEPLMAARCYVKAGSFERAIVSFYTLGSLELVAETYRRWAVVRPLMHETQLFEGEWEILCRLLRGNRSQQGAAIRRCASDLMLVQATVYLVQQMRYDEASSLLHEHRDVILAPLLERALDNVHDQPQIVTFLHKAGETKLADKLTAPLASLRVKRTLPSNDTQLASESSDKCLSEVNQLSTGPTLEVWPPETSYDGRRLIYHLDGEQTTGEQTTALDHSLVGMDIIKFYLDDLWQLGHTQSFQPGSIIVKHGEIPCGIFSVLEGRLAIYRKKDARLVLIDTIEAGFSFGQSWGLIDRHSDVQVVALTSTRIHVIEREKLAPIVLDTAQSLPAPRISENFILGLLHHVASRVTLPSNLSERYESAKAA